MVGCAFIAIGSERRKVGVSALITTRNKEKNFIVFPLFSLLFLRALSIRKLSLLLHRVVAQNAATQENSNNKQNNRSYGIFHYYRPELAETKKRDIKSCRLLPQGIRREV